MKRNILQLFGIITIFAVIFSMSLLTTSCNKDEDKDKTETPAAQDTVKTQVSSTTVDNTSQGQLAIDEATTSVISNMTSGKGSKSGCPSVSYDTTGSNTEVTFDYGSSPCTAASGIIFSGKVIATLSFTRPFTYSSIKDGKTIVLKFDSFTVNSQAIDGEITLTVKKNYLLQHNITFTDELKNVKVTTGGNDYTFSGTQDLVWDYGSTSTFSDYLDDTFTFKSGNILTGSTPEMGSFTSEIITDVVMKYCTDRYERVSGVEKITSTKPPVSIDYGTGACDGTAKATVTVKATFGGVDYESEITQEITF